MNSAWTKLPLKVQAWTVITFVVAFIVFTPHPTERWQIMFGVLVAIVVIVMMAVALVRFISYQDTKRLPRPQVVEEDSQERSGGSFTPNPIQRTGHRRIRWGRGEE